MKRRLLPPTAPPGAPRPALPGEPPAREAAGTPRHRGRSAGNGSPGGRSPGNRGAGGRSPGGWGFVLAALLLPALPAAAQDAPPPDVRGTVVEARSGEPMPGAMIRLLVHDSEGEGDLLEIASTNAEGRWEIRLRLDEDPGEVVVEVRALAHLTLVSDPFRLQPGETVEVPELVIDPDPVELEALEVRGERRWWQRRHPRDRVRDRQLEGKGVFIPGALLANREERSAAEAIAELLDGIDVDFGAGGIATLRANRSGPCPIVLVNEWRVGPTGDFALGRSSPQEIGVVEFYPSFRDLPEDLQRSLTQQLDRGGARGQRSLQGATTDEESCPVINVWRWSEWNRGRGGGP